MIEIKRLNKKDLLEFIHAEDFARLHDLPISFHRAISHTKNPRLDEDDVILLLAYNTNVLVGYLGILPDLVSFQRQPQKKIGWLSCMWVSPNARGMGIAVKLVNVALECWDNSICITEFTSEAKKLYAKTKQFLEIPIQKTGIRCYLKSDLSNLLPPKHKVFQTTKPVLSLLDDGINAVLNLRHILFNNKIEGVDIEYVDEVDDEADAFISQKQALQIFRRTKEELNWILQDPWILSRGNKTEEPTNYYFSSSARLFKFHVLKVRDKSGHLIAFMIFAQRNSSLKLPYLYYHNCIEDVIKIIQHHLVTWKIKTFTTFHPEVVSHFIGNGGPAILTRPFKRNYLFSNRYKDELFIPDFAIMDGDGDCSFT